MGVRLENVRVGDELQANWKKVPIHSEPRFKKKNDNNNIVAVYNRGDRFIVVDKIGDKWLLVDDSRGKRGYVFNGRFRDPKLARLGLSVVPLEQPAEIGAAESDKDLRDQLAAAENLKEALAGHLRIQQAELEALRGYEQLTERHAISVGELKALGLEKTNPATDLQAHGLTAADFELPRVTKETDFQIAGEDLTGRIERLDAAAKKKRAESPEEPETAPRTSATEGAIPASKIPTEVLEADKVIFAKLCARHARLAAEIEGKFSSVEELSNYGLKAEDLNQIDPEEFKVDSLEGAIPKVEEKILKIENALEELEKYADLGINIKFLRQFQQTSIQIEVNPEDAIHIQTCIYKLDELKKELEKPNQNFVPQKIKERTLAMLDFNAACARALKNLVSSTSKIAPRVTIQNIDLSDNHRSNPILASKITALETALSKSDIDEKRAEITKLLFTLEDLAQPS